MGQRTLGRWDYWARSDPRSLSIGKRRLASIRLEPSRSGDSTESWGHPSPPAEICRAQAIDRPEGSPTGVTLDTPLDRSGERGGLGCLRDLASHGEHQTHHLVRSIRRRLEHQRAPAVDHGDAVFPPVVRGGI
jgi:hypothetical protein